MKYWVPQKGDIAGGDKDDCGCGWLWITLVRILYSPQLSLSLYILSGYMLYYIIYTSTGVPCHISSYSHPFLDAFPIVLNHFRAGISQLAMFDDPRGYTVLVLSESLSSPSYTRIIIIIISIYISLYLHILYPIMVLILSIILCIILEVT